MWQKAAPTNEPPAENKTAEVVGPRTMAVSTTAEVAVESTEPSLPKVRSRPVRMVASNPVLAALVWLVAVRSGLR